MILSRGDIGQSRSKLFRAVVLSKGGRVIVSLGISIVCIELTFGKLVTGGRLHRSTGPHTYSTHECNILHLTISSSHRLTGLHTSHLANKTAHHISIGSCTAGCKSIGICAEYTHTSVLETLVKSLYTRGNSLSGLIINHLLKFGGQFFSQLLGRFFFFLARSQHAESQQSARGNEEKVFHGGNKIIYVPKISRICGACQGKV